MKFETIENENSAKKARSGAEVRKCFRLWSIAQNVEFGAVQKCAHLVELEKCCQTHIFLQNFVLIQPRTSPPKNLQIFEKCILPPLYHKNSNGDERPGVRLATGNRFLASWPFVRLILESILNDSKSWTTEVVLACHTLSYAVFSFHLRARIAQPCLR